MISPNPVLLRLKYLRHILRPARLRLSREMRGLPIKQDLRFKNFVGGGVRLSREIALMGQFRYIFDFFTNMNSRAYSEAQQETLLAQPENHLSGGQIFSYLAT